MPDQNFSLTYKLSSCLCPIFERHNVKTTITLGYDRPVWLPCYCLKFATLVRETDAEGNTYTTPMSFLECDQGRGSTPLMWKTSLACELITHHNTHTPGETGIYVEAVNNTDGTATGTYYLVYHQEGNPFFSPARVPSSFLLEGKNKEYVISVKSEFYLFPVYTNANIFPTCDSSILPELFKVSPNVRKEFGKISIDCCDSLGHFSTYDFNSLEEAVSACKVLGVRYVPDDLSWKGVNEL